MKKTIFLLFLILIIQTYSLAQVEPQPTLVNEYKSIDDLGFQNHLTNNISYTGFNVTIAVNSNTFTKEYKTRVTELYKNTSVNFAGKYVIVFWDASMGTTLGSLVDCTTGKAYDIPINDGTAYIGCFDDDKLNKFNNTFDGKKVLFTKESNLLVLRSCDEYEINGIVYRFYLWDEKVKKFTFLKIEKNKF
jgi:hypothetical protein